MNNVTHHANGERQTPPAFLERVRLVFICSFDFLICGSQNSNAIQVSVAQTANDPFQPMPRIDDIGTLNPELSAPKIDRKSTRINSSHMAISYAVSCMK